MARYLHMQLELMPKKRLYGLALILRLEHVRVIEWLNEVTPADMNWYILKIEAVKIGDSPCSASF
ncbi:hypothetical protein [Acetomicrobium sp.]|uniref:hypothetical protein n=1 Tax=Acetomicrobium sp. TaxID=1872099 RepID=UPI002FCB0AF9